MKKRVLAIVMLVAMLTPLFAACRKEDETKLTGFDVPEQVETSYGKMYSVPTYVPKDNKGNTYTVSYSVTNSGEAVEVFADKFTVSKTTDYKIDYTAAFDGVEFKKSSIVKVKDTVNPVVVLETIEQLYAVGATVTLPKATVQDDLDQDLTAEFTVTYNESSVALNSEKTGFVADKAGAYLITATAKDKAGNSGFATVEISARQNAAVGEVENFDSKWSELAFFPNSLSSKMDGGYVEGSQFGEQPYGDGFVFVKSTPKGSNDAYAYPGFSIVPRQSKAQIETSIADGYNKLVMRCYLDYTATRTIYQDWNGKQLNLGTIQPKVWTDFVVDKTGAEFVANYETIVKGIQNEGKNFIYVGNDPTYTSDKKKGDFKLYIDHISFVKSVSDITIADDFLKGEFAEGDDLDLSTFSAASASQPDAEFDLFVTDTLAGVTTQLIGDSFTFEHGGNYTFTAKFNNPNLLGSATKSVSVKGSVTNFDKTYAEAKAITDRESEEFAEKIEELKLVYQTLADADKATVYEKCVKLLSGMPDSAATYYGAIDNGAGVMSSSVGDEHTSTTARASSFDATKAYGFEYGSTKIVFTPWTSAWYGSMNITLGNSGVSDLTGYTHLEFWIMGTTWKADRPITFTVKDNTVGSKYIITNTATVNGVWQKVRVPLSAVTDISKITMRFYTKNGNDAWGSVWNEAGRMQVNISNIYLVKE